MNLEHAKKILPLPRLLVRLGLFEHEIRPGQHACPFHREAKGTALSVTHKNGRWLWNCFGACQRGGDEVTALEVQEHCGTDAAIARFLALAAEEAGGAGPLPAGMGYKRTSAPSADRNAWEALPSVPENAPPPPTHHSKWGAPSGVWTYHREDGTVAGVICRFDTSTGKEVLPLSWCKNAKGSEAWRWKAFAKPRPLYNLSEILARPDVTVLIVEGEKCAKIAGEQLPKLVVTTWASGSKAVGCTDWRPLAGRHVVVWPDADAPGRMAAQEIVRRLNSEECQAQSVRVLDPPEGVSEGWDVTDAVREAWPLQRWKAFLRGAHTVGPNAAGTLRVSAPGAGPSVACSGTETRDVQTQAQKNGAEAPVPAESAEEPFRILGHNHGIFYYRPHSTLSIVGLSAGQHKKLELLVLAPALYWEQRFPGRDGTDWFAVANNLIQRCKKREFDPGLIRGRGAVLDAKRVVFHKGGSLLVDGVEVALESFQSQWIYQRGLPLQVDLAAPLPAEKAARLLELTECFPFRRSVDAMLLAGWLAMAPVAGALEWRPHLWLSVSVR